MDRKKLILIIVLVAVAILIGLGLYFLFRSNQSSIFSHNGTTSTTGTLPSAGQQTFTTSTAGARQFTTVLPTAKLNGTTTPSYYRPQAVTKVSDDYANYSSANITNNNYRYYNSLDGKFYKVKADGTITTLNDNTFYNVSNVTWAKTKDTAVIEYPDNTKIIYNFEKNTKVTIPSYWKDFSFSPTGEEIAAKSIGLSPENRFLITTKDDGTGTKIIEPMGNNADYVTVDWSPSKQVVAFSQTGAPQGADRREVLMIGLNGENFKSLIVEGYDFGSQWSPTGQKLIYNVDSARSDYKPELWIVNSYGNSIGSNRTMLGIYTWADKCAFAGDTTLYCGVPKTLPTGAGMSRSVADNIYDDLYKIDITTGLKTPISMGNNNYTIKNISYDSKNNKLMFTDVNKVGIYQVNL